MKNFKIFLFLCLFFLIFPLTSYLSSQNLILKKQIRFNWGGKVDEFFGLILSNDNNLIANGSRMTLSILSIPDEAAIGKFDLEGRKIWVKTDSGLNGSYDSYSSLNATAIVNNNIVWLIDDSVFIKLDQNGNILLKKSIRNFAQGNPGLFITNWEDTVVVVEQRNNGNVVLLDENGNFIRSFPMQANGYGWMTPRVKDNTLWLSSNNAMFGTYVAQYNLETGQRNWIFYTPDDSFKSFRSMIELDSQKNVYCAGSKVKVYSTGIQKFFLYSLTPSGNLRWYTEWLPNGNWRLNQGNWAQSMTVSNYGIVYVGGSVERFRQPVDPNENDAYLAIFRTENGQMIEEQWWNYENGSRFSVNNDAVFADKTLILLGYAGNGPLTTWTWGYLRFYDILTTVESLIDLPISFNLEQNYPNPFNSSTNIEFSIPEKGFVSLKIYNILGKEIETLVEEEKEAGNHKIQWQPKNLPTGIYYLNLVANNKKATRKMVLLK